IEPALARRVRQRLDPTVVKVTATIEHNLLDALCGCALGESFSHRFRGFDICARFEATAHLLFQRGGRNNGLAVGIVDDLRINMLGRAEDREPDAVAGGAADLAPPLPRPPRRSVTRLSRLAAPPPLFVF